MNKRDLVASLVLMGFGAFVIYEASGMQYVYEFGPGPGFFPLWIGVGLVALAAVLAGLSLFRREDTLRASTDLWGKVRRVLGVWAGLLVMIAFVETAGFIVSFTLFTFLLVLALDRRPLATALTVAIGTAFGFYLIFIFALSLFLPVGPWGF
ncbi:MAG: tripartite tricarboxylate transporter TctB family protein [Candidatus Binatia bacterium]